LALDPQMQGFIDQLVAAGMPPDFAAIGAAAAKASSAAAGAMMGQGPDLPRIENLEIAGAAGPMAARLYVPEGKLGALLLFIHGGGWVLGTLDGYDAVLQRFAAKSGCAILSIDYRLAPEHPFPAPVEDCFAGLRWASENRTTLGLPADLPLVVGGDSAGGNLSAVVALLARDRGGPELAAQLLIYPATDCDFTTPSYLAHTAKLPLVSSAMTWFWDQYLPDADRRTDPLASPVRAEHHRDLAPAILVLAGYDPLYSEGDAYGAKLAADGVEVRRMCWDGLTHGFFQFAQILPPAGAAVDDMAMELRSLLKA